MGIDSEPSVGEVGGLAIPFMLASPPDAVDSKYDSSLALSEPDGAAMIQTVGSNATLLEMFDRRSSRLACLQAAGWHFGSSHKLRGVSSASIHMGLKRPPISANLS
eukprot:CAMPEP_0168826580 /NCGR_PEP_ID=MMETSP0726-20121227/12233_1 /TAXON_ID=265536 /ORGANISM="Amphiprora sp., Strain CCMP467" /LENGTH=105 /DNA_ID=CAMNT_0008879717 /DNA_START=229 /DNA_END=542 /DNA_ORIENTATION=+